MDIKTLKTFVSVVKNKNFSAAARELHTVQPTVSRHILELESELGVKLFYRNTHQVELTHSGSILFPEALKIIANNLRVIDLISQTEQQTEQSLNIGYLATASSFFLPHIINQFSQHYPCAATQLYEMSGQQQYDGLVEKKLDIIFCRHQPMLDMHNYQSLKIYTDKLVAVLPCSHRLAAEPSISLAELSNERFMMFHQAVWSDVFKYIQSLCKDLGFSPQMTYYPENMRHMATFVSSGLGVSIAPSCIKFVADENSICVPIEEVEMTMPLYMYYASNSDNPLLSQFVETSQSSIETIRSML